MGADTNSPVLIAREGDVLRLSPQEDLVASTVERQRDALIRALETPAPMVYLDLSLVGQVDSLGISLIVGLFKSCRAAGSEFKANNVSQNIMRVFTLFDLPNYFSIEEA